RTDEPSDHVLRMAAKAIDEFFKDGGDDRQAKALETVHGQRVDIDQFAGEDIKNEATEKDVPVIEDAPVAKKEVPLVKKEVHVAKDVPVAKKEATNAGWEMAWAQGSRVRSKILSAFE
ncbi:MAG: hypothetical protein Q9184_006721, partial [Pyrenodesmia sp. 2 TL-2023]